MLPIYLEIWWQNGTFFATIQKLAEMAEVLDARERKLLELSKANMDLREDNCILRM